MSRTINQIGDLLERFSDSVSRDDNARKVKEREASPGFASLDLFRTSEIIESRICAFLLNPRESHGQGTAFLNAFLKLVEFPALETTSKRVSVLREAPCYSLQVGVGNRQRRLDLLLEFPNGDVLAIENKGRGAQDGEGQIDAYLEHLQNEYRGRRRLLYLSREGTGPHTKSHSSSSDELVIRDYQETIGNWLNVCSKLCASPKVGEFLVELRRFMQTESEVKMNPEVSEVNSEIEKIMQDESSEGSSSLAVLLALYDARETVWKQAFSIFSQRLRELVKKHHPEWDISQGGLLAEHWDWIRFSDTSTDKAACVRYTVEILIQSQSGRTGDLGGGRVVLQLPTELLIGVYDGDGETLIRRHRPIRQIADIRSRDGVEYMLSAYSVEEITNEIERESASAKEELSSLRRTP